MAKKCFHNRCSKTLLLPWQYYESKLSLSYLPKLIMGYNKLDCGLGFMPIVKVLVALWVTDVSAFSFSLFHPKTAKQLSDPRTNDMCQPTSETVREPCASGWQT